MLSSHAENKPNLTRGMLVDHVEDTYGVRLSKKKCGRLLNNLGYSWKKMRGGYYKKKAKAEWVIAHRHHICLVLDFLHRHDEVFSIWYQDESAFRKNMYQEFAEVKNGDDGMEGIKSMHMIDIGIGDQVFLVHASKNYRRNGYKSLLLELHTSINAVEFLQQVCMHHQSTTLHCSVDMNDSAEMQVHSSHRTLPHSQLQ